MMQDTLLGSTGFVGNTPCHPYAFSRFFGSSNRERICYQYFRRLMCAGDLEEKKPARKNSGQSKGKSQVLVSSPNQPKGGNFILVPLVDIFFGSREKGTLCRSETPDFKKYRRTPFVLEVKITEILPQHSFTKLSDLFGRFLRRKTFIVLFKKRFRKTLDPRSKYKFYTMVSLCADIQHRLQRSIPYVHLKSEPLFLCSLAKKFLPAQKAYGTVSHLQSMIRNFYTPFYGKINSLFYTASKVKGSSPQYA